jgi:4-hydroxyacetophenone monooxygenase
MRWLYDCFPFYWNWYCFSRFIVFGETEAAQVYDKEWQESGGLISKANDTLREAATGYIRKKTEFNPALLEQLLPSHPPFARRNIVDNGWYDALAQDNVELICSAIESATPAGIRTVDGCEVPLDLLVLGTGFEVSQWFSPIDYRGLDGTTLHDIWSGDGARSYLGIMLPRFPNLFVFHGPNGGPRWGNYYSWAESLACYVVDAIFTVLEADSRSIVVKQSAYEDYNARQDAAMSNFVWQHEGKGSYYVNEHGRAVVTVPWTMSEYYEWMRAVVSDDFEIT